MSRDRTGRRRIATLAASCLIGGLAPAAIGMGAAHAVATDRDRDGMPDRWEVRYRLDPRLANAGGDQDGDGLSNLEEYRHRSNPRQEDTDGDGHDDGDELHDGFRSTSLVRADTDGDGVPDGDEDADRDGIDNEDEDDGRERCHFDDDDRDRDHVADEDENEQGSSPRDADSDDNDLADGDEDADDDGEANEDEDDDDRDACGDDGGEDVDDLLGTISGFDSGTRILTLETPGLRLLTFRVTSETEIEFEDADRDGSIADLVSGTAVAEVDVDDRTGALEEIALYAGASTDSERFDD